MRIPDLIAVKRDGGEIPPGDLRRFVSSVAAGQVPDYQVSAWLMAAYIRGLSREETVTLTLAMRDSGTVLEWDPGLHPLSDKHSTGGVGDKISLVLAPLAASMGVNVPMISGRSLGHTGGTLDKLESVPGMDVLPDTGEFMELVAVNGVAMSGQTPELAPADRILYALRDATSTVTSIPLICASILSKKLSEGTDSLVFDVKTGSGAFMRTREGAEELGGILVDVASEAGVKARAVITDMSIVLGQSAGNALEVTESMEVLRGRGPSDVRELSVRLAAEMAVSAGLSDSSPEQLIPVCEEHLDNGKAMDRFVRMIESQGGDLEAFERLDPAPCITEVRCSRSGLWAGVEAREAGEAVRELGGGRFRVEDTIRPMVGWEQLIPACTEVSAGDLIGRVHAGSAVESSRAEARITGAFVWDVQRNSLIYGVL
jgi:pyrimidine-nucleoside phosphorylase